MMYRIKVLYDAPGWAHWHRAQALVKYAPADFQVDTGSGLGGYTTHRYDLIFIIPGGWIRHLMRHLRAHKHADSTAVVAGINIGDAELVAKWAKIIREQGVTPLVNSKAAFDAAGEAQWISNGVDLDDFGVDVPIIDRPKRVLWTGSTWHSEKLFPERAQQEGGDTKRYWELLEPLKKRLASQGIECDYRRVHSTMQKMKDGRAILKHPAYLDRAELRQWYNSGQVYICASKTEGTPNPALEAAACGCAVVSTPVGNMPELIDGRNGAICGHTIDDLERGILDSLANIEVQSAAMLESIRSWSWQDVALEYFGLFRELIDVRRST